HSEVLGVLARLSPECIGSGKSEQANFITFPAEVNRGLGGFELQSLEVKPFLGEINVLEGLCSAISHAFGRERCFHTKSRDQSFRVPQEDKNHAFVLWQ